jgi:hypothetical protein
MMRFVRAALVAVVASSVAAAAEQAQSFRVISEDGPAEARRLTVRLDRRLSETDLAAIANALKAHQKAGTTTAAAAFYLPVMTTKDRAWAEAKFAASTQVAINGLRLDEEDAFRAAASRDGRDVIGHWLTSPPALTGMLTIVREKSGKLVAEWHLRNGQKTSDEVIESRAHNGRRFDVSGGDGSYYLATWSGPLELGQKSNVIAVAERLIVQKAEVAKAESAKPQTAKPAASDAKLSSAASATVPAGDAPVAATKTAETASPKSPAKHHRSAKVRETSQSGSSVADLVGTSLAR